MKNNKIKMEINKLHTNTLKLVDKYLLARTEIFVEEDKYKAELIMPIVLMSLSYDIMQEEFYQLKLRHAAKRSLNLWKNSIKNFNSGFFRLYNEEEQLQLVELVELFSDFTAEESKGLQYALSRRFPSLGENDKRILSSISMCSVITQAALATHHQFHSKKRSNLYIEAAKNYSEIFFDDYLEFIGLSNEDVIVSDELKKQVIDLMTKFRNKCREFSNTYLILEVNG